MSDLTQHATTRDPRPWQAEANPELDYGGNQGGMEDPPPDPDEDMPGDPPPMADEDYGGNQGGMEEDRPDPDEDMPVPPPEVAETNGR